MATIRNESETTELIEMVNKKIDKVYFTNRTAKLFFLQNLGVFPDLWVEDKPGWLFNNG